MKFSCKQLEVGIFIKFPADGAALCCRLQTPEPAFYFLTQRLQGSVMFPQHECETDGVCRRQAAQPGDFCVCFCPRRRTLKAVIEDYYEVWILDSVSVRYFPTCSLALKHTHTPTHTHWHTPVHTLRLCNLEEWRVVSAHGVVMMQGWESPPLFRISFWLFFNDQRPHFHSQKNETHYYVPWKDCSTSIWKKGHTGITS